MLLDMRLLPNAYDDRVFWGGFVSRDPRRQRISGSLFIYGVGIGVTGLYFAVLPFLPGVRGWKRGLLFVTLENVVRIPTVAVLNAVHPSVSTGELPQLTTWQYFWLATLRHGVFGITLGTLTKGES